MARKTFHFVAFAPMIWDRIDPSDTSTPVLDVHQTAPEGSPRKLLRTRVYNRVDTPHDGFDGFVGRHDVVRKYEEYVPPEEDGQEDDRMQERISIQLTGFQSYELRRNPGWIYTTASDSVQKSLFRRYRETSGQHGTTFNRRVVRIGELEESLNDMQVVGYTLANVLSSTPISNLDVRGQRMTDNVEVQNAKGRAGQIRSISVELQSGNSIVSVSISELGSVSFNNYPGDGIALSVLDTLDNYIDNSADMESIQIRQPRGG